jgi:FkbM family methyltransferase
MLRGMYIRLPAKWRYRLKVAYARRQIAKGTCAGAEPEWNRLGEWLREGDWAIDVGANLGIYTARMSKLVGPTGRVIALEPILESFSVLVANARYFAYPNVTLLNLAAGDGAAELGMKVPLWEDGTPNYYEAHVSFNGPLRVVAVPIDNLVLPGRVGLVKIDTEGQEAAVLRGMWEMLKRDQPVVVFERLAEARTLLESLGYQITCEDTSPNSVAVHPASRGSLTQPPAFARSTRFKG